MISRVSSASCTLMGNRKDSYGLSRREALDFCHLILKMAKTSLPNSITTYRLVDLGSGLLPWIQMAIPPKRFCSISPRKENIQTTPLKRTIPGNSVSTEGDRRCPVNRHEVFSE